MSVGIVDKQTGDRIPTAGMQAIDDALSAISDNPVQNAIITAALANKQDKTDNSLQTTDKTVVGAVNELKSGLTNLSNRQKSIGYYDYTEDNVYNVWTEHTVTVRELTNIMGVAITPVNNTVSQGFVHEAVLISVSGNQFTYAVKGGWSGGLNGVKVSYIVSGT